MSGATASGRPAPEKRGGWRRRVAWLACGAVLLSGGFFWASGGWDAWRHDRALDSACDGTLAAGPVRALTGGAEVTADIRRDRRDSWWQCRVAGVRDEDGRIDLRVTVWPGEERYAGIEAARTDAPLGHGWTGGFAFDPDRSGGDPGDAFATLLLDCRDKGRGWVSAEVRARTDRLDFGRPEARERLVAVLTGTATAYARRTGCEAAEGGPVTGVGVSATAWDHEPFATVSGSCAGILDPATAARWGVRTAVETARGPKAAEGCLFGGVRGAPLYEFTAFYGAALKSARYWLDPLGNTPGDSPDGYYALWASCPAGTAAYAVGAADHAGGLALDHPGLRAALARFAAASAKEHGCAAPRTERPTAG
ncbi:hypothetical protein [Streptomyces sp. NPDC048659]|uniref:hypothetical protein n=1 Tax=Streptomyces sp. NPDC048659 TaxID=3155489 RepID=UPI00341F78BD